MAFGARIFNGTGDIVSLPNGVATLLSSTTFSHSCWVYSSNWANAYNCIIGLFGTSPVKTYVKSNGKIAAYVSSSIYDGTGAATLSTNTWYHLSFTAQDVGGGNDTYTMYVNAVFDNNGTTASPNFTSPIFAIGNDQSSNFYAGVVADVAIWNGIVLTAGDISALAKGVRPYNIRQASLIGYWPLDGVNSPEPDLSGNANNGVLTGTANVAGPPLAFSTPRWPQFTDLGIVPPPKILMAQVCL